MVEVLATAYLTYVTTNTIGPFGLFDWLRSRFPHTSALGMFHCPWCMAFWVALIFCPIDLGDLRLGFAEVYSMAFLGGAIAWGLGYFQDFLKAWIDTRHPPQDL